MGIVGFSRMQEKLESLSAEKSSLDEDNLDTVGKLSVHANELAEQISAKKQEIEPLLTCMSSSYELFMLLVYQYLLYHENESSTVYY